MSPGPRRERLKQGAHRAILIRTLLENTDTFSPLAIGLEIRRRLDSQFASQRMVN
jgi:hypothetical protein